eukprot:3677189-Alexandrium_andersonii.AAC.1
MDRGQQREAERRRLSAMSLGVSESSMLAKCVSRQSIAVAMTCRFRVFVRVFALKRAMLLVRE